jgi:D-alanine--poly(phosphoribitol) ligase subunit 2
LTDTNAVIERLGALFVESFHIEVPSADVDLLESGILDSFQMVQLLFDLEQRFGFRIKIVDIDLVDFRTLSRIAPLVVAANGNAADSLTQNSASAERVGSPGNLPD